MALKFTRRLQLYLSSRMCYHGSILLITFVLYAIFASLYIMGDEHTLKDSTSTQASCTHAAQNPERAVYNGTAT
jgi:hypothetical protein